MHGIKKKSKRSGISYCAEDDNVVGKISAVPEIQVLCLYVELGDSGWIMAG